MVKLSRRRRTKRIPMVFRVIILVVISFLLASVFLLYNTFRKIYQPNVVIEDAKSTFLFIPTGASMEDVVNLLYEKNLIQKRSSFEWLAEKKNYHNHVRPGRYRLEDGMSNNSLINMLRSGRQEPVQLTFNNIRTLEELAGTIGSQMELDSVQLLKLLRDNSFLSQFGYDKRTVMSLFIPNTYELYWNTSTKAFFERMQNENNRFWNRNRLSKLKNTGLTKTEAYTLASIVEEETNKTDEFSVIAGVYLNRIKRGMRLQADPTVKFAVGDFTITRVLKKHLRVDSPYNTYKYAGLPPGPIRMASINAIDGVLNFQKHHYLFFCAREDFSGYHRFARTLQEHNRNARLYQNELNRRRIMR